MLEYVKQHVPLAGTAPLCGNSIGVDRRFLDRYMRELDGYVHYRSIDVSSFKELCRRWYPAIYRKRPGKTETHRALDDIRESIEELRYYRENLFIPEQLRLTRDYSSSRKAPSSETTDRSRAEWPMRPMRQPLPASAPKPAADFDREARPQLAAHLRVVDPFGQPHAGEFGQPAFFGERAESELGECVLQERTDMTMPGAGGFESFVEQHAEPRMQRVQHRDRRGVVIPARAADIVGDQRKVEIPATAPDVARVVHALDGARRRS